MSDITELLRPLRTANRMHRTKSSPPVQPLPPGTDLSAVRDAVDVAWGEAHRCAELGDIPHLRYKASWWVEATNLEAATARVS